MITLNTFSCVYRYKTYPTRLLSLGGVCNLVIGTPLCVAFLTQYEIAWSVGPGYFFIPYFFLRCLRQERTQQKQAIHITTDCAMGLDVLI